MEYKVQGAKLQDIVTHTEEIYATVAELGEISSGNLLINADSIQSDLEDTDIFLAHNLTADEALTPTIVDGNLVLDGSTALTASNKIHLVIKLKTV